MLCSPLPHHHQGYHHHHHHHHVLQQQQQKLKIQHQHQQHHHHQTRYGGEEYALDSYLWKASAQWRYSAGDPLGAQRARAAANAQVGKGIQIYGRLIVWEYGCGRRTFA